MRLVRNTVAFCAAALLLIVNLSSADTALRVNESATRAVIKYTSVELSLALENPSDKAINARIKVEMLNAYDLVRASVEKEINIAPGSSRFNCELAMDPDLRPNWSNYEESKKVIWYRLRYHIITDSSGRATDGIISLSEIAPEAFSIKVAGSREAVEGKPYRVTVYAAHPITHHPAKGVNVEAELELSDDDDVKTQVKASGITGEDGYATLSVNLPESTGASDCEIKVTGQRDGHMRVAENEIDIDQLAFINISFDKPIYQPGQTLHLRTLVRDNFTNKPVADTDANVIITDPEGTTVFRSTIKTSRFGIASTQWSVPESTKLGEYEVVIELEDGKYADSRNSSQIKISRYELPTFAVSVKPDRAYYMSGQNALVEVRADYLFGKPVPGGRVRIVRESEREWNYREQKWEIEEGEKYEGTADQSGQFLAQISLRDHHKELKENDNLNFSDISYAAYITDPATNRTEQQRFDLRVTRQAIHVYVVESYLHRTGEMPAEFYVITFYADGSPAESEVEVCLIDESKKRARNATLRRVHTNRYGLAKVSSLVISNDSIELLARDRNGRTGSSYHNLTTQSNDAAVIRITTSKTIHRAGEPIETRIESNKPDLTCVVNIENEQRILNSQVIKLRDGQAKLTLPYTEEFAGKLSIVAYASNTADDIQQKFVSDSYNIIYPIDRELKLDVELPQDTYRPGENASVAFRIRDHEGQSVESALGVVVIDRAVEERARTDQQFGPGISFCGAYTQPDQMIGGVTISSLNKLDMSKPLPDGLDLVAEVLLNRYRSWRVNEFDGGDYDIDQQSIFSWLIGQQVKPIESTLNRRFLEKREYAYDSESLNRILADSGINFNHVKDPWGNIYRARFYVITNTEYIELTSAGADKRFDTADDFVGTTPIGWSYFQLHGETINRAVELYHKRTGRFIRDVATLRSELARVGMLLDDLRDKWDRPYIIRFGIDNSHYLINFVSGGQSGFEKNDSGTYDYFTIWTSRIDYFEEQRAKIGAVLGNYFDSTKQVPQNLAELRRTFRRAGLDFDDLRDGWGRSCYAIFKSESRYADRVSVESRAPYGGTPQNRTKITPVTQKINFIEIRSAGLDGRQGTTDDFTLAGYSNIVSERSSHDDKPKPSIIKVAFSRGVGTIQGYVTDAMGGAVAKVKVRAINQDSQKIYETETDTKGRYILGNVPVGRYEVHFEASGFNRTIYTDVNVNAFNVTTIEATLPPAGVSETVTVTAAAETMQTQSSVVSVDGGRVVSRRVSAMNKSGGPQISTPRLREYFPETLVWQPQIETDANGQAQINFKLADNITTWKLSVVASTINGDIGVAEREIRAFQPFFVEHDPPRFLTEGDEIDLPVIVRNYLDKPQSVNIEMKPESWFAVTRGTERQAKIEASNIAREIFSFRAIDFVKDGKQRVTAQTAETGDAIEKPVTVRANGEEVIETAGHVFSDSATLEVNLPDDVINNTARAELKIYPNLMSHIIESVEGIMKRPYGCAEQTISSTYPSLLVLRYYKDRGEDLPLVVRQAQRYVQVGYERLLNYEGEQGEFSYWGRGESDIALTAYALWFLSEASEFITVDESVIKRARKALFKQQQADGGWKTEYGYGREESKHRVMLTSSIVRVLAKSQVKKTDAEKASLKRALDYLAVRIEEIDEPYAIATYAIAAMDNGEKERARRFIEKLRAIAYDEGDTSYWELKTNTPFYGWGLAGRIETTALAVKAIVAYSDQSSTATQNDKLIDRGLRFLIRKKDSYGVWYSTQATINVLDTITTLISAYRSYGSANTQAEILINGRSATTLTMPREDKLTGLITVDLSKFLDRGSNRIEIRRVAGSLVASAQLVSSYYRPWNRITSGITESKASDNLRLRINFDKREARIGDEITCRVEAERIGHRGYGMLLAEIGLPPGAEVDRQSLEQAMKASGRDIGQYDVLPDRVIVYLWPRAGGTKFEFKFRPRYGIRAQSAPSTIYDYYNPEAHTFVQPVKFTVR